MDIEKPISPFRSWVRNLWLENCEERQIYNDSKLEESEYWNRFKWWIRREYRRIQQLEKG